MLFLFLFRAEFRVFPRLRLGATGITFGTQFGICYRLAEPAWDIEPVPREDGDIEHAAHLSLRP